MPTRDESLAQIAILNTKIDEQEQRGLALIAARDAALAERDAAIVAKDAAIVELEAANATKDALIVARDATIAELQALLAELQGRPEVPIEVTTAVQTALDNINDNFLPPAEA